MGISAKHEQFINEYLQCWNGTDAYIAVYGPVKRTTAAANSARILANPSVKDALQQRMGESAMLSDEVLMRLAAIARGDMGEYLVSNSDGVSIDMGKALAAKRSGLIKRLNCKRTERTVGDETVTETLYTVELHDPLTALQLIGKHHRLFADKSEVSGPNGGPIEVAEIEAANNRLQDRIERLAIRLAGSGVNYDN